MVHIERVPGERDFRLTTQQVLEVPRAEVFRFFADAYQLETLTPQWLKFAVQTPRPIEMKQGAVINYRLRLHGLPVAWRTRISEWEPPYRFVDEQEHGPYHRWHHLHTFEAQDGGTLVRDVVHYRAPLSWFTHPLFVRRDLTRIFEFRRAALSEVFAGSPRA